jgi:hypothetical protein
MLGEASEWSDGRKMGRGGGEGSDVNGRKEGR